jgi:regulatory protein
MAAESKAASAEIRRAAMDLLARREHGRRELMEKLSRRFDDLDAVAAALEQLAREGLQSDQRFAEVFVHSRAQRLYGPLRIRQELQQRGIAAELIAAALEESGIDWLERLGRLQQGRFGDVPAADAKERARRLRFLQQRGFSFEQWRQLERQCR